MVANFAPTLQRLALMPYDRPGILEGLPSEPATALAAFSVVIFNMWTLSRLDGNIACKRLL